MGKRRDWRIGVASGALVLLLLGAFIHRAVAAGPITLHVDDDSTCLSGCGSTASPYPRIQPAINDANARIVAGTATGAVIEVHAGNYPEHIFVYPNVHVRCDAPSTTTIDATGWGRSAVIFASGGVTRPREDFSIDGCTITGGSGEVRPTEQTVAGGGVFVFGDAVVSDNVITGNILSGSESDWVGAGIYVAFGDATITGNTITGNVADPPPLGGDRSSFGVGAGLFALGPLAGSGVHVHVEGNRFEGNFAGGEVGKGGGLRIDGYPGTIVTRNVLSGNYATYSGGAMQAYGTVTISDNLLYGNSASMFGAGLDAFQVVAQITNNTIVGGSLTRTDVPGGYNYASYGGGISIDALISQVEDPQVHITNTIVAGNSVTATGTGGGLFTYQTAPIISSTDIWNNTRQPDLVDNVRGDFTDPDVLAIPGNLAADPLFTEAPAFTDVTIADGTTDTLQLIDTSRFSVNGIIEYDDDGVARTVTAIDAGTGTVTFTPARAEPSEAFRLVAAWGIGSPVAENFRLLPGSPGLDAGTGAGVTAFDLDGAPRVADADCDGTVIIDLGAYELIPPDADGDGTCDALDCAPLVNSVWTFPGEAGATLTAGPGLPTPIAWGKIDQANASNVYRGVRNGPFAYNQVCHESASPDLMSTDSSSPAIGSMFYYLISGINACAEGSLGLASDGSLRPNLDPCPIAPGDADADGVPDLDDNCPLAGNPTQIDADLDGWGNACDNCADQANPNQLDVDADVHGDACDNCPLIFNPDQADRDLDAEGDRCDLDDGFIHIEGTGGLMWQPEIGTDPADPFTSFNLYRGDPAALDDVDLDGAAESYGACLASGLTSPAYEDATIPDLDAVFFYLVTGVNLAGEGPLGEASSGAARPNVLPCP